MTDDPGMTIDQLAAAAGTTTRRVRALQTLGVLPHPALRGRTGLYGPAHRDRLDAVLRLQDQGFSLESVRVLFAAFDAGASLADVLGLPGSSEALAVAPAPLSGASARSGADDAELYGFADLQGQGNARSPRPESSRRLLSVVPTTVWDESEAS